jgi:uncharacterized protein YecT (DUF1311 family)
LKKGIKILIAMIISAELITIALSKMDTIVSNQLLGELKYPFSGIEKLDPDYLSNVTTEPRNLAPEQNNNERKTKRPPEKKTSALAILQKLYYSDSLNLRTKIFYYFQDHKELPQYLADFGCSRKDECGTGAYRGAFYFSREGVYISLTPTIAEGRVTFECRSNTLDDTGMMQECVYEDEFFIPKPERPSFDCDAAIKFVERAICSSDRLTSLDIRMESAFRSALKRQSDPKILEENQMHFIKSIDSNCTDQNCIKIFSEVRVLYLESL